jgi:hypothetical protein
MSVAFSIVFVILFYLLFCFVLFYFILFYCNFNFWRCNLSGRYPSCLLVQSQISVKRLEILNFYEHRTIRSGESAWHGKGQGNCVHHLLLLQATWSECIYGVSSLFETTSYCFHIHHHQLIFIRPSYGLDDPGFESWQKRNIFLFCKTSVLALGPTQPPTQWVPVLFPVGGGVKLPERDVDHSLPTSAVVKNEWSYTSAPSICLQGVGRDDFELILCLVGGRHRVLKYLFSFFL